MQSWVEEALMRRFADWSYEETIKGKMLFLQYLGHAFAKQEDAEAQRLAEHLESFGGQEQATLFAGGTMVPAPLAAFGNAVLLDQLLVYPTVLAAVEQLNKGGQELIAALLAGLEATYRLGDHPQAQIVGALVGVAHAFELDVAGLEAMLGCLLRERTVYDLVLPATGIARGLLAQDLVLAGSIAREEWSEELLQPVPWPDVWAELLERHSDEPGLPEFLLALEVNVDQTVADFRARAEGKVPHPHIEYYVDAVMAMEDICCVPLFFRR